MKRKRHIGLAIGLALAGAAIGPAGAWAGSKEDAQLCTRNKGTQAEQLAVCTRAIGSGAFAGDELAELIMRRGTLYSLVGQNQAAMRDFDAAIALRPDDAGFRLQRGIAHAGNDAHERAVRDFDEALRREPRNPTARYFRGHSRAALGLHDEALDDYDRALELKPDFASALVFRGLLLESLGRRERAVADYTTAYKLGARGGQLLARLRAYKVIK